MTQHADSTQAPATATTGPSEPPETDDPVVLRELLRQAREHLRLRESIEQMMAENVARTEALLVEARAARPQDAVPDRETLGEAVADARLSLQRAMGAIERLETLLTTPGDATSFIEDSASGHQPEPVATSNPLAPDAAPRTIEVLMHQVHTPALARSAQQHLLGIEGVTSAEVRELAEGLLRITVISTRPMTEQSLADWEPDRGRVVRTSSADVLELELEQRDS